MDARAPFAKDLTHNYFSWVELPAVRTLKVSNDVLLNNAKLVVSNCVMTAGGSLVLTNSGRLYVYAGETNAGTAAYGALVSAGHAVLIASNSWIFPVSHWTNGGSALFRMTDLTIATTNAGFNADGFGYGSHTQYPGIYFNLGYGPGGGGYRSGAGFGGKGRHVPRRDIREHERPPPMRKRRRFPGKRARLMGRGAGLVDVGACCWKADQREGLVRGDCLDADPAAPSSSGAPVSGDRPTPPWLLRAETGRSPAAGEAGEEGLRFGSGPFLP